MTRRILIERAAELDVAEITISLRERHPASATKFVKAARAAFRLLATQPEMGRRYQTPHPLLQNLRVWQVKGFEKYLIFYRAARTSIYIERVLYGGRDIERVLIEEVWDCRHYGACTVYEVAQRGRQEAAYWK